MRQIKQKLDELIKIAEINFPGYDFSYVTFKMNPRLTSTAGRAFYALGALDFSVKLYEANREEFLQDTVAHELAHLVANRVYMSTGHDANWRKVAKLLGSTGERCHSYQVSTKKVHLFKCSCMTHEFTPQRYAWVKRGKLYKCNFCHEFLKEV